MSTKTLPKLDEEVSTKGEINKIAITSRLSPEWGILNFKQEDGYFIVAISNGKCEFNAKYPKKSINELNSNYETIEIIWKWEITIKGGYRRPDTYGWVPYLKGVI